MIVIFWKTPDETQYALPAYSTTTFSHSQECENVVIRTFLDFTAGAKFHSRFLA